MNPEDRLLVLAPTGRDGPLTCELLERDGHAPFLCGSVEELVAEGKRGATALLVAEEVLRPAACADIGEWLKTQPPWSDLPVLVFTGEGTHLAGRASAAALLGPEANVTLLDRPLRPVTMLSAARAARRARLRQYEARAELERRADAVRLRDQFLAMLGHELRNPLGNILLAVDILARGTHPEPGNVHELIRRQGRHLTRLVDDLLDVARVTTGKVHLKRELLDLGELVERCVATGSMPAASQGVELRYEPGPPVVVDGDRVRLEQVFGNLIANAIKFTPRGGHVMVSTALEDGRATVRVSDDGVGFDEEARAHLFDLFAQSARTLDRSGGGLGIGLTVVRSLVSLHGGSVDARSDGLGRGAEFVVRLDVVRTAAAPTATRAVARKGHRRRVLVIEDNPEALGLMVTLLGELGHEVTAAADGTSGVERALVDRPDALVIDIGLPGLDGYAVAERVRAALGPEVLLVALTGYGQPEDRRRALGAGFDAHLVKPVDTAELQRLLTTAETVKVSPAT